MKLEVGKRYKCTAVEEGWNAAEGKIFRCLYESNKEEYRNQEMAMLDESTERLYWSSLDGILYIPETDIVLAKFDEEYAGE